MIFFCFFLPVAEDEHVMANRVFLSVSSASLKSSQDRPDCSFLAQP